jgi:hypothetical protein
LEENLSKIFAEQGRKNIILEEVIVSTSYNSDIEELKKLNYIDEASDGNLWIWGMNLKIDSELQPEEIAILRTQKI